MTSHLRRSARAALLAGAIALQLASCAKGGSSFDEDFANAGKAPDDPGSINGDGSGDGAGGTGSGAPGSGDGDVSEMRCGNGVIDAGEECDGALLGGATCQSLGFSSGGALNCDPQTCTYDESMCRRPPGVGTGGTGG